MTNRTTQAELCLKEFQQFSHDLAVIECMQVVLCKLEWAYKFNRQDAAILLKDLLSEMENLKED